MQLQTLVRLAGGALLAPAIVLSVAGPASARTVTHQGPTTGRMASAIPAPEPREVAGNPMTCEGAELAGEIILGGPNTSGSASSDAGTGTVTGTQTLDVTINEGFTATGIVVKGGPNANVYVGPFVGPIEVEGMTSPINPVTGTPFDISYWFVCGFEAQPTATPTATSTATPTTTPTAPPTATPTRTKLPITGDSLSGPSIVVPAALGGGLLLLGSMLIVLYRRRDGEARG
ncbi:hypothetical protein ACGF7U_15180 [Micromonospora sp. NPDC047670]|uniref:hypothetical protein n=1 Tax=Micromonospora sp. NPDC047670 TaxID=3364252 RepID=UPI00371711AD